MVSHVRGRGQVWQSLWTGGLPSVCCAGADGLHVRLDEQMAVPVLSMSMLGSSRCTRHPGLQHGLYAVTCYLYGVLSRQHM